MAIQNLGCVSVLILASLLPFNAEAQRSKKIYGLGLEELLRIDLDRDVHPIKADPAFYQSDRVFTIGLLVPYLEQGLGSFALQTANLAAFEINRAGGIQGKTVYVVMADYANKIDIAVERAEELIQTYHAQLIVGPYNSDAVLQVARKVTIKRGVPLITPGATAPGIADLQDNGTVWRTAPSDVLEGRATAAFLVDKIKKKKACVFFSDDTYGTELADQFRRSYVERGGEVLCQQSYSPVVDYDTETMLPKMRTMLAHQPAVIFMITRTKPGAVAANTIMGYKDIAAAAKPTLFWTSSTHGRRLLDNGLFYGVKPAYGILVAPTRDQVFNSNYRKRYNEEPRTYWFVHGTYDAIYLAALAMLQAKSTVSAKFVKHLQSVSKQGQKVSVGEFARGKLLIQQGQDIDYDGLLGPIAFDDQGDASAAIYEVWTLQGKTLDIYETIHVGPK